MWSIYLETETGLLPLVTTILLSYSAEEAAEIENEYQVGKKLSNEPFNHPDKALRTREYVQLLMEHGMVLGPSGIGDEDASLAFDVLERAEISRFMGLSPSVIAFFDDNRLKFLKEKFGENWSVAAAFEYCWIKLPHSSPAFVAAAYQYHHYITGEDFVAGYYWRDLENLTSGVEEAAIDVKKMRQKAGVGGSLKSAHSRSARRINLLEFMESISRRNPDLARLGLKALAQLAMEECWNAEPTLWTQGKGQVEEYLGEIKRGEAGQDLQARLLALLAKKPLKQSD